MMISGITNDSSITKFAVVAGRLCQRSMPIANITPIGTATSIVPSDSLSVWKIAWCSSGSLKSEASSWFHHVRPNPWNVLFDRPALKESNTAIETGRIDHARQAQVIVSRIRGFRHGSLHHLGFRLVDGAERSKAGDSGRETVTLT